MPKVLKRVLQVIGIILVVAIVVVGGYIIYLEVTYNRIADNVGVEVDNNPNATLKANTAYKAATYNIAAVPTCRNNDVPYEKGYTYTVTVDGFVVSSNVKATAENIDAEFQYSDHNPVLLTFELQ